MKDLQEAFREQGVVRIRGALDEHAQKLADEAYCWSLNHPGPGARSVLAGEVGEFYQDHANPEAFPVYRPLLCETGLAELVAGVLGSNSLWLLYEQIWLKEGTDTFRTPWHQDLPYVPMSGDHLATAWINLDPVARHDSLEFILGSHRGPLFNPTAFQASDPSAAMFAPGIWPALPDIDAAPDRWPTASWEISPSDIIVFHPAILHGGAATVEGGRRRTMSLRFFGDRAFCAKRPEQGLAESDRLTTDDGRGDPMVVMARKPEGTVFRHPDFPRLC